MSVISDSPTAAVPRPLTSARAWAVSDRAAQFALAGLFLVLAVLSWSAWGDLTMDTGYDLLAAVAHRRRRAAVRRLQLLLRPARTAPARRHLRRHRRRRLAGRRARARPLGARHRR